MKFLHVADAHLDSPFLGISFLPKDKLNQLKSATQHAFTKMINYAIKEQVDFVLLVGDIFDSPTPTPKTQTFLMQELNRLAQNKIHTYLSFGNHDYMQRENLLVQNSEYLDIFGPEVMTKSIKIGDVFVDITGFSYQTNHIEADLLAQFPPKISGHYTIGTLHGSEMSSDLSQNIYAPFRLAELKAKNYNYFALGHIHKRQNLSLDPIIGYSGNLQGRNINESEQKGFYEVQVDENLNSIQKFIPTSDFIWQKITINLPDDVTKSKLTDTLVALINNKLENKTLIELDIQNSEVLSAVLMEILMNRDYLLEVSQSLKFESLIVRIKLAITNKIQLAKTDQKFFDLAAKKIFTLEQIQDLLGRNATSFDFIQTHFSDESYLAQLQTNTELVLKQQFKVEEDED